MNSMTNQIVVNKMEADLSDVGSRVDGKVCLRASPLGEGGGWNMAGTEKGKRRDPKK